MKKVPLFTCFIILAFLPSWAYAVRGNLELGKHDLQFPKPAESWDEGIPLGNGMLGALVWKKEERLRLSLDRADLWDLRPMGNLSGSEWKFRWVCGQWQQNTYESVQKRFDEPYQHEPAPTKIPAAAVAFNTRELGEYASVSLNLKRALCEVKWKNGARLLTFVHATEPVGWFRFEGLTAMPNIELIPPPFNVKGRSSADPSVNDQDLYQLGYAEGSVEKKNDSIIYTQPGWRGFHYQVSVRWRQPYKWTIEGCWSISSWFPGGERPVPAAEVTKRLLKSGFAGALESHESWWRAFWAKSSIAIPDQVLERQWYLEQYKFGATARASGPPISLQGVWTADNARLPPWKGDFHHDLNTEMSYWPAYSSNHLEEASGFLNWLWHHRKTFKQYTASYFETNGLNVPGVSTLSGEPMGGWVQYAFGPTVSAWLGQHFYLHWRYSMDRKFLQERAYPWIREVAIYLDELSVRDASGKRKLSISSSPEIFNNSRQAWFAQTTNFDLALIRFTYEKAAELAGVLGNRKEEVQRWEKILGEWPDFAVDPETGFLLAPGFQYRESHRHFSHLLAFHPLGLIDWSKGKADQGLIRATLSRLEQGGHDQWCGYSYSWLANLKARAFDGQGAAEALRTFATCFCLPNSFHVNGDQSGTGKSKFTYRPFTLEGNFAFAAGLQEMLIQSHSGVVRLFPAILGEWAEVSFDNLRVEGAFLISARMSRAKVEEVLISSEKGGILTLQNPFNEPFSSTGSGGKAVLRDGLITIPFAAQQKIVLTALKSPSGSKPYARKSCRPQKQVQQGSSAVE